MYHTCICTMLSFVHDVGRIRYATLCGFVVLKHRIGRARHDKLITFMWLTSLMRFEPLGAALPSIADMHPHACPLAFPRKAVSIFPRCEFFRGGNVGRCRKSARSSQAGLHVTKLCRNRTSIRNDGRNTFDKGRTRAERHSMLPKHNDQGAIFLPLLARRSINRHGQLKFKLPGDFRFTGMGKAKSRTVLQRYRRLRN